MGHNGASPGLCGDLAVWLGVASRGHASLPACCGGCHCPWNRRPAPTPHPDSPGGAHPITRPWRSHPSVSHRSHAAASLTYLPTPTLCLEPLPSRDRGNSTSRGPGTVPIQPPNSPAQKGLLPPHLQAPRPGRGRTQAVGAHSGRYQAPPHRAPPHRAPPHWAPPPYRRHRPAQLTCLLDDVPQPPAQRKDPRPLTQAGPLGRHPCPRPAVSLRVRPGKW